MTRESRETLEIILYAVAVTVWGQGVFRLPFEIWFTAGLVPGLMLAIYQVEARKPKRRAEVPLHLGPSHAGLLTLLGFVLVLLILGLMLALVALAIG